MRDIVTNKVEASRLINSFVRSLFINAAWNFSKMQNIGFVYAMIPVAEKFIQKKRDLLTRHVQSFSTHPYFASIIIGSIIKVEESCEGNDSGGSEAINLKQALAGPYAALGDPFFWGSLRPASALLGVTLIFMEFESAPVVFLVIFNSLHFWMRLKGFMEGYRDGMGALKFLQGMDIPDKGKVVRWISLLLLIFLASVLLTFPAHEGSDYLTEILNGVSVLAIILACVFLISKRVPSMVILYGASILFLFIAV